MGRIFVEIAKTFFLLFCLLMAGNYYRGNISTKTVFNVLIVSVFTSVAVVMLLSFVTPMLLKWLRNNDDQ